MNVKHIKTAVITMLVLANIFFYYNLYTLKDKTSKIPKQMIEDAVTVLNRNGLNITKEVIPDMKPQNLIYDGVYSPETFEEIVKSLSETEISTIFPMSGGALYSAGEYNFDFLFPRRDEVTGLYNFDSSDYFTVKISLNLSEQIEPDIHGNHSNSMEYEDLKTITEKLISNGLKNYKKMDIAKAEDVIVYFLKKYQPGSVDFETIGFQKNEESEYIVIKQKLDGLDFDSHIVFVEISDKKVRNFIGKWYFGAFAGSYPMPLFDSVNILFKCLEKDGNIIQELGELKKMELYYSVVWHEVDKFYLSPSWRLNFDNGKELSYNTVIGNNTVKN